MTTLTAILLKIAATFVFVLMNTMIRLVDKNIPIGEVMFFRGAFAVLPVLVFYAWRGQLRGTLRMGRPSSHVVRGSASALGMYLSFTSVLLLPLVDATAIGFTAPLITVAMAAVFLKEPVHVFRWVALAVGLAGVLVMNAPHFDLARFTTTGFTAGGAVGVVAGLLGALVNSANVIQTRRMTFTETTGAIVFYFSLFCAAGGLLTLPFGWAMPVPADFGLLVMVGILGGAGHLILTESFRRAPASVIAPFDYTAMVWAFVLGYALFGEFPENIVFVGTFVVVGAGLVVIWHERKIPRPIAKNADPSDASK